MNIEVNLMHTIGLTQDEILDLIIEKQGLEGVDRTRCRVRPKYDGPQYKFGGKERPSFSGIEVVVVNETDPPEPKPRRRVARPKAAP